MPITHLLRNVVSGSAETLCVYCTCVCVFVLRQDAFSWEHCQVCCSWKIVLKGVYSREPLNDFPFLRRVDVAVLADLHVSICSTACTCVSCVFDRMNVHMWLFILYLYRACGLLNILSGHVKCERNRAQDVQFWPSVHPEHTHSLTHLHTRVHAYSCFLPILPALSCLHPSTATHGIMALL